MKTAKQTLTLEEKIIAKVKESMSDLVTNEELNEYASRAIKEAISNTIKNYTSDYNNPIKDASRKIVNNLIESMNDDEEIRQLITELFVKNLPYLLMDLMRDSFKRTMDYNNHEVESRIMERLSRARF